jgi:hypothetical protein
VKIIFTHPQSKDRDFNFAEFPRVLKIAERYTEVKEGCWGDIVGRWDTHSVV